MIRVFDAFSGIGGFRSAFERVGGFKTVGWCEIDRFAQKSYRALFDTGGEQFYENIRDIDTAGLADFDLLVGGFPCQPFSVAGKRLGTADERGDLFFELARILEAKRPRYFIFENVPGLLGIEKGQTFKVILETLSELGYCVEWLVHENATTQNIRIQYVQLFCKYLHNNGMDAPYVFHPLPKRDRKFIPYIFTEEEITRLISAIDKHNSVPAVGTPIRHLVHPVLFRVLCGCGLRINEALTLKTEDVDLSQGIFLIREAKGGKDRMIVLSDSLKEICCAYRAEPVIQEYGHEYFFPNRDHGYYDSSTIYADFRKYLLLSGIPHRGRGHGPRLHDLRHTFAVRVLSNWQREGKDLYTCLPILQTYLGHSQLSATEKYLRLVPELYSQVTEAFKAEFGSIFPEVQYEER